VKVLVTGAEGKVGRALVPALIRAGHDVRAVDLAPPEWDRHVDPRRSADYVQADLTDAASCDAVVRGCDAVVHAAAIPAPLHHPPHVVFRNNALATFNVIEAAVAAGVQRVVNFSSETVPGFIFAYRSFKPAYLPIDEEHPIRPQDPYAQAKWFGELMCDRAVERADLGCVSVRPSWVQDVASYERNLGPIVRDPSLAIGNYCAYIDVYDLCEATLRAVDSQLPGHEVVYIASPDTIGGHPLRDVVRLSDPQGEIRIKEPLAREDASPIDSSKAQRLLGWEPTRSWSDYLDEQGRLREGVAEPW
jgi:nucleoside-diphosphate-sugar epimerase